MLNVRGAVNITEGELGGTAPNTTEPVPRNLQVPFSCPHNVYCRPDTVMVLAACALSAPNHANTVAAATPMSFKLLVIDCMYR
ncbi:hypothetical protein PQQ51_03420 [Paraburkholderia xenovorans]